MYLSMTAVATERKPHKGRPVSASLSTTPQCFSQQLLSKHKQISELLPHFPGFTTRPVILQGLKR